MTFSESIRSALSQYVTFSGRACRSEFWWFYVLQALVTLPPTLLISAFPESLVAMAAYAVSWLVQFALLLPYLALSVRRLHDSGRRGWWLLTLFPAMVFFFFRSDEGPNNYGENPLAGSSPNPSRDSHTHISTPQTEREAVATRIPDRIDPAYAGEVASREGLREVNAPSSGLLITQSRIDREPDEMTDTDDLEFYSTAAKELKDGIRNDGLWLKARVETGGDDAKAELAYVQLRVKILAQEAAAERLAANREMAAEHERLAAVRRGLDVAAARSDGLCQAATRGESESLRELLKSGTSPDVRNENGATPIYLAALNGHIRVVKILLENGADATISNSDGVTPKEVAVRARWPKIADLLP